MNHRCHHGNKLESLFTIALFIAMFFVPQGGSAIVIKPGRLDHFAIKTPEVMRAGEEFSVELQAFDKYDNLITNYAETGKDIQVTVSGGAGLRPDIVKASSFTAGIARITVLDKKAESIVFSVYEAGGTVPLYTKQVEIIPNKPSSFVVKSPESVSAGRAFEATITAKDAFGNTVRDGTLSTDIRVFSTGNVELKTISPLIFKDGISIISLITEKTGVASFEVRDIVKGGSGKSQDITITPASLNHFSIIVPEEVTAGRPFEITITAMDAFNNIASNYSSYGVGANILSSGKATVSPSYVKPLEFKEGRAVLNLTCEKAEHIYLTIIEAGKTQEGKSPIIRVEPSGIDRFVLIMPEDAVAGQGFRIKIEAYDRFENIIKNYNIKGTDIMLRTSGTGTLIPDKVSAVDFIEGVASVDISYDKAESFSISVVAISKEEPQKEKPLQVIEKRPPEEKLPPKKEEKPKVEVKKIPPKAKKPEAKIPKKEKITKKAPEKGPFSVSDITIVEAENKALFVIKIPGISTGLSYKEGLEHLEGKDWVKVRLTPAVNRISKPLMFKSAFIGEVKVRDVEGGLDILFELLPTKVKYDIERSADSLIIILTPL
ncbi:MAG: hypothetical protein HY805_03270 [Nitrospirae bacterium]|nr:hypothetical protein [Nitrospirota bacterium]